MYGSCWFTRPAVLEDEGGSGVGKEVSRCSRSETAAMQSRVLRDVHTAIESFTSCGRLESFNAAAAIEANRTKQQLPRGARNAAEIRLEESRKAIAPEKHRYGSEKARRQSYSWGITQVESCLA